MSELSYFTYPRVYGVNLPLYVADGGIIIVARDAKEAEDIAVKMLVEKHQGKDYQIEINGGEWKITYKGFWEDRYYPTKIRKLDKKVFIHYKDDRKNTDYDSRAS